MPKRKVVDKHYQLTEYENRMLQQLVVDSGSGKEIDVIRDLILGSEILEAPGQEFYDAMKEIHKIGVNMNQIAHMANAMGVIDAEEYRHQTEMLENKLAEIKRIVLEPRIKSDIRKMDRFLEYAVFETEEKDMAALKIREELMQLMTGTIRREADGNNKDMAGT